MFRQPSGADEGADAITLRCSPKRLRAGSIRSPAALPRMAVCGRAFLSERAEDNRSRYYKGGLAAKRRNPPMLCGGFRGACRRAGHLGRTRRLNLPYKTQENKGGGTPADVFLTSASCDAARVQAARARLSAFHRGSCCSERTPQLSSRYALPGTWSGARPRWFERPCALQRMMKDHASPAGVTRSFLSQSSELPRRPVIVPAGRNSRSRPGADCIGPRAGTALAPLSGVPSAEGVLHRARFDGLSRADVAMQVTEVIKPDREHRRLRSFSFATKEIRWR